jgi:hypothetical protein
MCKMKNVITMRSKHVQATPTIDVIALKPNFPIIQNEAPRFRIF